MATRDRKLLVTIPGLLAVAIWLLLAVAGTTLLIASLTGGTSWGGAGAAVLLGLLLLIALNGFVIVQPNQAKVATFLGRYLGTIRRGVAVLDTRLRRLAYAPEIAADMLRRQQADAIVAARQRIVEGAVGMVDHALSSLSERDIVDLDEERKATMVSNLMVVLVSDRGAQPVVNSGSLYT
jgi:hypothetical protein